MQFNGAPSFVAYAQRDADYGQIIEGKADDENMLKVAATGFPATQGPWLKLPSKKEDAPATDNKDPAGNPVVAKLWWDEEEKMMRTEIRNEKKKNLTMITRKIDENDVLHLQCVATKDDGTKGSFDCTFKRVG